MGGGGGVGGGVGGVAARIGIQTCSLLTPAQSFNHLAMGHSKHAESKSRRVKISSGGLGCPKMARVHASRFCRLHCSLHSSASLLISVTSMTSPHENC